MKCDTIPDLERFLTIQEQALGATSSEVALTAGKLANLYLSDNRLDDAERLLRRALTIQENLVGFHHDDIAKTKDSLTKIVNLKKGIRTAAEKAITKPVEVPLKSAAEPSVQNQMISGTRFGALPERTSSLATTSSKSKTIHDSIKETELEIDLLRQMVGADDPSVADLLTKLADLYCRLRMYSQMEPVLVDALKIREAACGANHPSVSTELKNLARLYLAQERYALAEPLFKRALVIREKAYGKMHPRVADIEESYAQLLRKTNRACLADTLERHVNAIRSQHLPDANRKATVFQGRW
ncbi:MAG TPA: tetratricopeptide repeat-containing protein [Drouetiella sp.]